MSLDPLYELTKRINVIEKYIVQSKLSSKASFRTEESDCCRKLAINQRLGCNMTLVCLQGCKIFVVKKCLL